MGDKTVELVKELYFSHTYPKCCPYVDFEAGQGSGVCSWVEGEECHMVGVTCPFYSPIECSEVH